MRIISFSAAANVAGADKFVVDAAKQTPDETIGFIEMVGKIEDGTIIIPIPRANSALLQIATLWAACSFELGLTSLGKEPTLIETVDIQAWRNDKGRKFRAKLRPSTSDSTLVVNAGRSLTCKQAQDLRSQIGEFSEVMVAPNRQFDFSDGEKLLADIVDELLGVLEQRHIGQSVYFVPPGAGQAAVLFGVAFSALTENFPIGVFLEADENREFQFSRLEYYGKMVQEGQQLAKSWNKKIILDESLALAILSKLPTGPEKDALAALLG